MTRTSSFEDRLSSRNFARLSKYIYDYSGIKMPPSKLTMLEGRLRKRLRATGIATFDRYCDFLFRDGGLETESIYLIDAVTTNKTDFFREPNHFDYMASVVLPELARAGHRRVRAWSSACSTGAEPYTMAMVLADFAEATPGIEFKILASDLSTEVLETARAGIYPRDLISPVPPAMQAKYVMTAIDRKRREVRIVPSLRARIGFARLNLMDASYGVGDPMHMIFCRNVLIYFDKQTQAHVLSRLCDCLAPGGYLFIGHSESVTGIPLPVRQVANTIFRKV
ncbi:CheR family methyltransferase [Ensifer soli]|uniref:CheR family methyltransferase n=1 Tax=Ciceribacter sp. sgz301302 TaxID=3342379 RepID=UPI0035BAEEB8